MSITAKYSEAMDQINAMTADKSKLEAVALELKDQIIKLGQAHAAEVGKLNEQIAKMQADAKAADELMAQAGSAKADLEKLVAEKDELIKEMDAKLKLAPFGDVSEGQKSVAAGGEAAAPVSHLAELNRLGQFTPQGVAYYRKHEKEINAEVSAIRK